MVELRTDDGLMAQEYFEEAEAGASVIAVLAPEPRLYTEAGQILVAPGARRIRFYGNTTITDPRVIARCPLHTPRMRGRRRQ